MPEPEVVVTDVEQVRSTARNALLPMDLAVVVLVQVNPTGVPAPAIHETEAVVGIPVFSRHTNFVSVPPCWLTDQSVIVYDVVVVLYAPEVPLHVGWEVNSHNGVVPLLVVPPVPHAGTARAKFF